jgi:hypothetical protein
MKFRKFEKSGSGAGARFVSRFTDAASDEQFEMTIAGPSPLVEQVLAEAEIELTIDSHRTQDDLMADFAPALAEQRRLTWEVAALEDIAAFFKPAPTSPRRETTVMAAIRPAAGQGTPFTLVVSRFFVPAGVSFLFFGSFALTALGSVLPASGDQDLFLRLFTPSGPILAASTGGGTALDLVTFTFPLVPWIPVFDVRGFTTGVCATFAATGA